MVVFSNFLAPQEGIRHKEQNTTVSINDRELGKGTLYITESLLSWVNYDTQQGFSLEYPDISLHGILRDKLHPRKCLYIVVDAKVDLPDAPLPPSSGSGSENEDEDADPNFTEMRFAPDDTNNLDAMFQAMNQCQALYPDPQDSFSDAEEDIYEDAEEDDFENYEAGAGDAPYTVPPGINYNGTEADEAMDIEAGQFEDAEEDP
ncbi:chloride nucleotide-sensitive channel icln isoform X2 [Colletes latitarsis]|uniref:chloride nucleotide-sensitive channel icln isoform X2 n=1 Tax=Colletes latitarsis TaxID=2605962 RepID=UPI004035D759